MALHSRIILTSSLISAILSAYLTRDGTTHSIAVVAGLLHVIPLFCWTIVMVVLMDLAEHRECMRICRCCWTISMPYNQHKYVSRRFPLFTVSCQQFSVFFRSIARKRLHYVYWDPQSIDSSPLRLFIIQDLVDILHRLQHQDRDVR